MTTNDCPLCLSASTSVFADLPPRRYFACSTCDLVFLDPAQRPNREQERAEYDLHENTPDDPRYRKHLSHLTGPLTQGLPPGAIGLDFGSGPGPAISVMLAEEGFDVTNYDPIYAPAHAALSQVYDFIACTEAAEHFHNPGQEFERLARCLRSSGPVRLGIMTQMLLPDIDFTTWRYRHQPSHVVFYTPKTMDWIATRFEWTLDLRLPDVALFTR